MSAVDVAKGKVLGGKALFTLGEVRAAAGGRNPGGAGDLDAPILSVAIDSRNCAEGALFVALKGEAADGHDFAENAFRNGAAAALVSRMPRVSQEYSGRLVLVEDTLKALHALAACHVRKFPRLIKVGITGSSGKTTTKEMVAAICAAERSTVANEGNLNSETGLPLSVFRIGPEHEVGVFEMGMNHKGEMGALAGILFPDIALITNIGTAHIGILGSRDAIALEKKQIFSRFAGSQTGFAYEDDPYLGFLAEGVNGRVLPYGRRATPGYRGSADLGLDGVSVDWEGLRIRLPLPGGHNLLNALGAIAVALELGLSREAVKEGLESVKPLFGRGEVLRGFATAIRDCYNSNPDSLGRAVAFCDALPWRGRKVYAIGSMLELGTESEKAHAEAGRALAASGASALFFFGKETEPAAREALAAGYAGKLAWTESMEELVKELSAFVAEGDLVLLKASRGMELERAAACVTRREEGE
jgi:UDP-N-acetylmuramoyl-tripeptide--D-alanyl-D-alanine ligase